MLFFINSTFNQKNSGIEHAQLKRASLFREHKEAFKLVFREWNPSIQNNKNQLDKDFQIHQNIRQHLLVQVGLLQNIGHAQ